jgi:phosphoribosylglycinamide formyltransferase-1
MLLKLAILISGRGSNMRAILNAVKKQGIPINPVVVISNKPTAGGLRIAKKYGVKTEIVESKGFQGTKTLSRVLFWFRFVRNLMFF